MFEYQMTPLTQALYISYKKSKFLQEVSMQFMVLLLFIYLFMVNFAYLQMNNDE